MSGRIRKFNQIYDLIGHGTIVALVSIPIYYIGKTKIGATVFKFLDDYALVWVGLIALWLIWFMVKRPMKDFSTTDSDLTKLD